MKAVFDTKPGSGYDDDLTQHYHFPRQYAPLVSRCVGDWVILRRPRADGGNLAYFAVARVARVEPDLNTIGHSYARLTDYLQFDTPVPWTTNGRYAEEALRRIPRTQVGVSMRGRSVRPLSDFDFSDIVCSGLKDTLNPENADRFGLYSVSGDLPASDDLSAPTGERVRRIESVLVNRMFREASFRRAVCQAYGERCAITGLRMINGGGRSEVQAAHIWPVFDGGPDVVQNGIALSGTIHWLFDRHLISLTDDYRLLVSHNRVPTELQALFVHQSDRILLPADSRSWPHPSYLARHRELFSGAL